MGTRGFDLSLGLKEQDLEVWVCQLVGLAGSWHSADACVSTVGVWCGVVLSVTAESPVCMGNGNYGASSCHLIGPGLQWWPLVGMQAPVKQCCPVRTHHRSVSLRALHLPI